MNLRTIGLLLVLGYFLFSVVFVYVVGFADPRRAVWVGLIGLMVMALAMALRTIGRKK